MTSGPITSWQIDGETVETVSDFIFLGSKITADGDCSHEIKRRLLLGRKAMTNLSSVQFSRLVVSNSLWPHESQHARPPCPSPTPRVHSDSHPLSRQHIKKHAHHFADKGPSSQNYGFSSSPVWTWELDHKEGWAPKNWCFQTVVLEKTLESPLDTKEIKPVNPKGNQPWILIGRTDAEAPILWPPDVKRRFIGKDSDAGKDWRQEEKGMTQDEMVRWHYQLNRDEFE